MKTFTKLALGLTILAAWAAPVSAANKAVAEEGAVELVLLRQQSVQKELKLSEAEVDKIHKFAAEQWEKAEKASKLGDAEQDKEFDKLGKENEKFVEKTLTKAQQKRLQEITLQIAGLQCVTRHDLASKLKLTADQKKRVQEMQKEARKEAEDLLYATDKSKQREKLRELREINRKRVQELLTDEQELAWKNMTGEPFTGDLAFFDSAQASE
jgi:hypothetical protein